MGKSLLQGAWVGKKHTFSKIRSGILFKKIQTQFEFIANPYSLVQNGKKRALAIVQSPIELFNNHGMKTILQNLKQGHALRAVSY
jgi:hypothetical protein